MYQFIHIETYSHHSKYNKKNPEKSRKSFDTVEREIMRHPNATPHVTAPQPPNILYSTDAYEVSEIAKYCAEQGRSIKHRRRQLDNKHRFLRRLKTSNLLMILKNIHRKCSYISYVRTRRSSKVKMHY